MPSIPSQVQRDYVKILSEKLRSYRRLQAMRNYLQKHESLKNARIRKQKLLEIVSTERDYVQNIHICVDEFLKPMKSNPKKYGVTEDELDILFLNINQILQCNQVLLQKLNDQVSDHQQGKTSCVKFGIVFKEMAVWFKLYTDYINNHELATTTHDNLMEKKKKFAAFMEKQQNNPKCKNLPLAAYLIQPVQRIPRYRLLLADVIKLTPEDHVDYEDLQKGYQAILDIADWVNERKRENENQNSLAKLQLKITDVEQKQVFLPHRKLISKTDTLKVTLAYKEHDTEFDKYLTINRPSTAYLFPDMLILSLGEAQGENTSQLVSPQQFSKILARDNLVMVFFVFIKILKVEYMQPTEEQQESDNSVPNTIQIAFQLKGRELFLELNLESCDHHFSKKILAYMHSSRKNIGNKTGMDWEQFYDVASNFQSLMREIPELKEQMKKKREKATKIQNEVQTMINEIARKEEEVRRLQQEIEHLKTQKIYSLNELNDAEREAQVISADYREASEEKNQVQETVFSIIGQDLFAYTEMFGTTNRQKTEDINIVLE
ncbi:hypothetical protein C9374_001320 [Naegleria lovaniensis]|uniref:DH domain-containing protein n=1 Tax=Naegleria lovaniensis TaxID=51637 RepID=A0AA88GXG7_NAELO|nr:uncharacterized protein C9374_001320 [Naegleria lovaniensis]KAG2387726.1 hypothetical protein C9374_001320 [Naegleria lovaniensis]